MEVKKHVIIGNGAAGTAAARSIRSRRPDDHILIVSDEPHLSYWRGLLPDYLAGTASIDRLWLYPESYYRESRIEVRLGTRVMSVSPEENVIVTQDDTRIAFDRLLIACGGEPSIPRIQGMADANPFTLKTLSDAQRILARVRRGSSVLLVARDLIGVELARAFSSMGVRVTYIEWDDELLPHLLDVATAEELRDRMRAAGISLVLGEKLMEVKAAGGKITLDTSCRTCDGDALAVAVGLAPSVDWLKESGIGAASGIIVDERLRTNYPNIFAAGDAAEVYDPRVKQRKVLFGWKNAVEQGTVAGANMCGETEDLERIDIAYAIDHKHIFGVDVRHRWR